MAILLIKLLKVTYSEFKLILLSMVQDHLDMLELSFGTTYPYLLETYLCEIHSKMN